MTRNTIGNIWYSFNEDGVPDEKKLCYLKFKDGSNGIGSYDGYDWFDEEGGLWICDKNYFPKFWTYIPTLEELENGVDSDAILFFLDNDEEEEK